jgi:hypothetical protein
MDMKKYQKLNEGHRCILVAIDCLSRYAWIRALRNKESNVVAAAFADILESMTQSKPHVIHSDAGREFTGRPFQQLLRDNNIRFFTSQSNFKAAIVERFIRTLKERFARFFRARNGTRWYDCLREFQDMYNNTPHRSLMGLTPKEAASNPVLLSIIWQEEEERGEPKPPKFQVGDLVRTQLWKGLLDKGHTDRWSLEIYRVSRILRQHNPFMYLLEDSLTEEPLQGAFNSAELQKVELPADEATVFEQVVSIDRTNPRDWHYLVRWQDRPPYALQWLAESGMTPEVRRNLRNVHR